MPEIGNLPSRIATALWQRQHPEWSLDEPGAPRFELGWSQTPRYLTDRLSEKLNRTRQAKDVPWITPDAIAALSTLLLPTDTGLEFGAGSSTTWFAERTRSVVSIEPSQQWYDAVRGKLAAQGLDNVDLRYMPAGDDVHEHRAAVLAAMDDFGDEGLDYVFVDGLYRDVEAQRATKVVRSGGLIIVDNVNTYLPGPGRSPWRVSEPATPAWQEFADTVAGWRHIWTTSGVWDTAIWIKP